MEKFVENRGKKVFHKGVWNSVEFSNWHVDKKSLSHKKISHLST